MRNLNLIAATLFFAFFALTSCQKEKMSEMTTTTPTTITPERNMPVKGIQVDYEEVKKQVAAYLQGAQIEDANIDYEALKAQVEAYNSGEINSASYKQTARDRSNTIIFEAFWWGYHFIIPQSVMVELDKAEDIRNKILEYSSVIAMVSGPLAPFVELVIFKIRLEFELMKLANQGKGIYLSAIWFNPTFLVPTPI